MEGSLASIWNAADVLFVSAGGVDVRVTVRGVSGVVTVVVVVPVVCVTGMSGSVFTVVPARVFCITAGVVVWDMPAGVVVEVLNIAASVPRDAVVSMEPVEEARPTPVSPVVPVVAVPEGVVVKEEPAEASPDPMTPVVVVVAPVVTACPVVPVVVE